MKGRSSGRTGIFAAVALAAGLAFAPRAFAGESLRAVRGGLAMTLRVDSGENEGTKDAPVVAGEIGRIVLEIQEAKSGLRKTGLHPEAWIDFSERPDLGQRGKVGCEKKAGLFQSGGFGTHPLIDLNRYFILTLNDDPTVSVIDPMAGMAGMTKLYTLINLKSPGADWIQSANGSGVTLIRPDDGVEIAEIPTGRGHHEIAFSKARRHLFVSNREEGTVTVIDTERRASIAQIRTGPLPMGSFRTYGHKPNGVGVIDRVLREDAPGLFSAPVQFPVAGTYELILRLRNPDLLHCFRFRVEPNPSEEERVEVEYLNEIGSAQVGDTVELKFRLVEVKSRRVLSISEKVQVVYYRVPGSGRTHLYAEYLGKGIYRGRFKVTDPGAYYVSASCPSCGSDVSLLSFETISNPGVTRQPREHHGAGIQRVRDGTVDTNHGRLRRDFHPTRGSTSIAASDPRV